MKRLLNHLPVHRGITDITMIFLATDVSTETDIDTSTVRKGTEAGSMRLNGVGMAIAMIDMDMTRAARPGNLGGPEKGRRGSRWIMFVSFCLL